CAADPLLSELGRLERIRRCLEVAHHGPETRIACSREDFSCKRMGYRGDLGSRPAEPMVRRRAGEREPIFYDIKPVHAVFGRTNATTRGKCAHRREIALAAIEKIAVQCKDDICAIEPGDRACPHSKSALRRHASSLTQEWLINAPTHAREIFFQLS